MPWGELSIADILRSVAALQPGNAEALETLCGLLQFELDRKRGAFPKPDEPGPPVSRRSLEEERLPVPKQERPSQLRELPGQEEALLPWEQVAALPAQPRVTERPAIEPLLPSRVRSAMLSTAISMREETGELDLARAVQSIASGQVLARLPRVPVPSLRRGVQVLADLGEGMLPYAADRGELSVAIQRIAGKEQTELLRFAGTPLRGAGPGPRHRWGRWVPPPRGTPVLLLTDLGLGGPLLSHDRAPLGEWLRFSEEARRGGCPLLAFVPYEPERWPAELARVITLLPWDRGTTVSAIAKRVRRGDGGLP